ncbi:LysR substrate-binding domain-containing protein [Azospirillum canadense]|uniref:LysR substrate-binding domain-containing protein n=1 Tax=Azospirillum canadense TaxID=403962 RepID=UPI002226AE34|nr:LysR substrate-binding domain-containing protein [Azospirillum canadense]MCW2239258.1 DNA-binding transcriptional LysR family regulator [Azospirillum canadense]
MALLRCAKYLILENNLLKTGKMLLSGQLSASASPLDRHWDLMRVFLAVAREGALLRGAKALDEPLSSVHRQIGALESALSAQLFTRSSTGLKPTPAGHSLLNTAETMDDAAATALQTVTALRGAGRQPQTPAPTLNGQWDGLRIFLAYARTGTFVRAAAEAGMSFETARRHLYSLEHALGLALSTRSRGAIHLTPAGDALHTAALVMEAAVADANRSLAGLNQRPEGLVRIATTDGLGAFWVTPRLERLYERFPGLGVQLQYRPHQPDLANGEADLWIGYSEPQAKALIRMPLGRIDFRPVASRSYLARHGTPWSWDELASDHWLLTHSYYTEHSDDPDFARWGRICRGSPRVRLETDLSMSLLAATVAGHGISLQPSGVLDQHDTLALVDLPCAATAPFWLVYHEHLRHIARYRAVIEETIAIMTQAGLR